jgi:hypothetical protein
MELLTTGMIAGRLIHHRRLQRKKANSQTSSSLSAMVIFIESAALSTFSKAAQLPIQILSIPAEVQTIPSGVGYNPFVIPLTVSSSHLASIGNLINEYLDYRTEFDHPA